MNYSLQKLRQAYQPALPDILKEISSIEFHRGSPTTPEKDVEEIKKIFPKTFGQSVVFAKRGAKRKARALRIGVVFSGGQAAGGHNVVAGLFDAMQSLDKESTLLGFLDGPGGIVSGKYKTITNVDAYRNQGGFDMIGSGRTKIETEEQLQASLDTCKNLKLDGLVVIGGDDSNTNAAVLAEYFLEKGVPTKVVGVPKTIDGDLKNSYVATSFGFDTACKVYSEMIGNIERDALSAKKYYHFIKLMGRSASHIALECALSTQPNLTLIGEEVAKEKRSLKDITNQIADLITKRAEIGKNYGVILIPEGIIEFIPEIGVLISELNKLAEKGNPTLQQTIEMLSRESKNCFIQLPERIQAQLTLERDPHGNVQVSLIETERLLIEMVAKELEGRKAKGSYKGKFSPLHHFLGYEGRCSYPSNFDSQYCYALGKTACLLLDEGLTGYMCYATGLNKKTEDWEVGGVPITMFLNMEIRKNKKKPVIEKALVDLNGKIFKYFDSHREKWEVEDAYVFPGPIQFFGDRELTDRKSISLSLEEK